MLRDLSVLSFSNLKRRRLRSWLTMLGIFIGIAAVVALISLGEGLRVAIIGQFGFLGTDVLSVQASGSGIAGPPGMGVAEPLTDDLAGKIENVDGVVAAINRYIKTGTLEFNNVQGIGFAMSMPSGEHRKIIEEMLNVKAEQGRLLKEGDTRRVLLGNTFTNPDTWGGKGIKAGDRVIINSISYEVAGIMEKKGSFLLDGSVIINEEQLLKDFGDDGNVNVIGIKVKDEKMMDKVKEDIEKLLRKERGVKKGEENFEVQSPQKILETLTSTLFAVQLFVYIIAIISLLVGGIGIMNTMYTAVLERTKEIGILKSIGARNSAIFTMFFIESGLLGVVGGIVGIVVGLIFAYGLAFIGRFALGSDLIQAHANLFLIFGSLMFSFFVGTIFGVLPALQASKLQPVESLRGAK